MSIRAFSIQKKEHLWEFPLSSLGKWKNSWDEERFFEVYKLIGIYNNIFFGFYRDRRLYRLRHQNRRAEISYF